MRALDLGCGKHRHAKAIGIDLNPNSDANVIADLESIPYPFGNNSFSLIYCDGILEHLGDVVRVMEELHRIAEPSARIHVTTPYFTSLDAFTDPTHKHYFSSRSFDYFTGQFPEYSFYSSTAKFAKRQVEIQFWALPRLGGIRPQHFLGAHLMARWATSLYERFFAYLLPAQSIRFELEVIKE